MAESTKQSNKERLKDITDSIERGIQDLFQSDKYAEYSNQIGNTVDKNRD